MAITSASAILTLSVNGLFGPTQLQGFSTDEIYSIGELQAAETMMGADGILTAGFIFQSVSQTIDLMADSGSNALFDQWYSAEQQAKRKFIASGTIYLHGTGTTYDLTRGFLKTYKPAPDGGKTLKPRKYTIEWQSIIPAPQQ